MRSINRRNQKIAGRLLIVFGSLIIIFVIAVNAIDLVKSTSAIGEFKKDQDPIVIEMSDGNANATSPDNEEALPVKPDIAAELVADENLNAKSNEKPEENTTLCLLKISKIKLEEAVKEGSTKGVLSSALGHVENTALPGEDGNCCIAGHRNYVFGKYFNRLEEVTLGDVIELRTKDHLYQYEVVSTEVVEPEEVSVLDYVEGKNLTLITCTPFMVGTHRLIVHAVMK